MGFNSGFKGLKLAMYSLTMALSSPKMKHVGEM